MRKPTSNPRDRWFGHSVAHHAVGNPPPSETQRPSAPQHNHHDNEHGDNIFLCRIYEDDSFGQADDLIVECDMRCGTPPKNLKNTTDPINALRQPEVEHRFHFLNHGTVSIIQIRLTCLSWTSAMLQCIKSQGITRVHTWYSCMYSISVHLVLMVVILFSLFGPTPGGASHLSFILKTLQKKKQYEWSKTFPVVCAQRNPLCENIFNLAQPIVRGPSSGCRVRPEIIVGILSLSGLRFLGS